MTLFQGRRTFQRYVAAAWPPNHEVEVTTRERYACSSYRRIMPELGPMRMIGVSPSTCVSGVIALKGRV